MVMAMWIRGGMEAPGETGLKGSLQRPCEKAAGGGSLCWRVLHSRPPSLLILPIYILFHHVFMLWTRPQPGFIGGGGKFWVAGQQIYNVSIYVFYIILKMGGPIESELTVAPSGQHLYPGNSDIDRAARVVVTHCRVHTLVGGGTGR